MLCQAEMMLIMGSSQTSVNCSFQHDNVNVRKRAKKSGIWFSWVES